MAKERGHLALSVSTVLALVATLVVVVAFGSPSGAAGQRCFGREVTVSVASGDEPSNDSGEVILGTPGDDVIHGTRGNDVICGGGGDDIIQGGPGNDWIRGGKGDDQLFGGPGADRLFGGRGSDFLHAGQRPGRVDGGRGVDECVGNRGSKRCEPPCLDLSRISDNETIEIDGPIDASRCRIGCRSHCDVEVGMKVFVNTTDGEFVELEHVDENFEPAGPLPLSLPKGDTVMTIGLVNRPMACPDDSARTTEVWVSDLLNTINHDLDREACGLAFTAVWDR